MVKNLEIEIGKFFIVDNEIFLVFVCSGAVFLMFGMMDIILNLGLND